MIVGHRDSFLHLENGGFDQMESFQSVLKLVAVVVVVMMVMMKSILMVQIENRLLFLTLPVLPAPPEAYLVCM